jgi:nucleotide-binding universal stress UspA family protein
MKRILCALDGSPRAPIVLAAAARLAELADAKLVLFRAVSLPVELPSEVMRVTDRSLEDVLRRKARTDLEGVAQGLRPGLVEKYVVELATGWDGICRAAIEQQVDLIVLGSHGYGGLDRLLGTTASKVVNHADRNVLVVRTPL